MGRRGDCCRLWEYGTDWTAGIPACMSVASTRKRVSRFPRFDARKSHGVAGKDACGPVRWRHKTFAVIVIVFDFGG